MLRFAPMAASINVFNMAQAGITDCQTLELHSNTSFFEFDIGAFERWLDVKL